MIVAMRTSTRTTTTPPGVVRALAYPGRLIQRPEILGGHGDDDTAPDGGAPLADRVPVVAIGSNANRTTLRRKLISAGVRLDVPLFPVLVGGVAVAHSAHVSLGGYVAAAPVADPRGVARGVLAWFDASQVRALDASEPNYVRGLADADRYPLTVVGGLAAPRFWIYRSVPGVLTLDGRPARLRSQAALHATLRLDAALRARLPLHDAVATVMALRRRHTQAWLRRHWADSGQSSADGLTLAT